MKYRGKFGWGDGYRHVREGIEAFRICVDQLCEEAEACSAASDPEAYLPNYREGMEEAMGRPRGLAWRVEGDWPPALR